MDWILRSLRATVIATCLWSAAPARASDAQPGTSVVPFATLDDGGAIRPLDLAAARTGVTSQPTSGTPITPPIGVGYYSTHVADALTQADQARFEQDLDAALGAWDTRMTEYQASVCGANFSPYFEDVRGRVVGASLRTSARDTLYGSSIGVLVVKGVTQTPVGGAPTIASTSLGKLDGDTFSGDPIKVRWRNASWWQTWYFAPLSDRPGIVVFWDDYAPLSEEVRVSSLAHELGHMLGLRHHDAEPNMMYPTSDPDMATLELPLVLRQAIAGSRPCDLEVTWTGWGTHSEAEYQDADDPATPGIETGACGSAYLTTCEREAWASGGVTKRWSSDVSSAISPTWSDSDGHPRYTAGLGLATRLGSTDATSTSLDVELSDQVGQGSGGYVAMGSGVCASWSARVSSTAVVASSLDIPPIAVTLTWDQRVALGDLTGGSFALTLYGTGTDQTTWNSGAYDPTLDQTCADNEDSERPIGWSWDIGPVGTLHCSGPACSWAGPRDDGVLSVSATLRSR
ncbi:MAG TPA: hypothetical protein PKA64_20460 [Myxococcota bacterium]|nr:hypothetical protein [Myxococcota bacterium]